MYGYIYKTTNKINGKIYVGQKVSNIFIESYRGSGIVLKRAINKYGVDNFVTDVLEWCETKEDLNLREKYWIKQLNATNSYIGYNLADGGQGGNLGDKINNKISKSLTGRNTWSKGRTIYNNGCHEIRLLPDEDIPKGFVKGRLPVKDASIDKWKNTMNEKSITEKAEIINRAVQSRKITWENKSEYDKLLIGMHISQSKRGKPLTEEHKQKLRKPKTEEHKQKLRKPFTEEHKQKLSEARIASGASKGSNNPRAKKVLCIETGVEYSYSGEAEQCTGISNRQIRKCCLGKCDSAGGFHWRYILDDNKRN